MSEVKREVKREVKPADALKGLGTILLFAIIVFVFVLFIVGFFSAA